MKFNNFLLKRLVFLFIIFAAVNFSACLNISGFRIDILQQFVYQYFLISFIFTAGFIYLSFFNRKMLVFSALSLIICGINYADIHKYYAFSDKTSIEQGLKIGLYNVYTPNKAKQKVIEEIRNEKPDAVILQEIDNLWINELSVLKEEYPYFIEHPRLDNFGIALYSKLPFEKYEIEKWTEAEIPVISAQMQHNGRKFKIYAVHTLPPVSREYIEIRNEMLAEIKNIIEDNKNIPLVIAGDLNTTVYSSAYKRHIASSRISDAGVLKGSHKGSWHAHFIPFLRLPIEHILVNSNVKVNSYKLGKYFHSDHLPIYAHLDFK